MTTEPKTPTRRGCHRPKAVSFRAAAMVACGLCAVAASSGAAQSANDDALVGAWTVERYDQRDGGTLPVTGRIFFTDRDWTVLFFVLDQSGRPARGSGEGGTYTLRGRDLVFTHHFNLSAESGDASPGLVSRSVEEGVEEPCTIEVEGDGLTILFPSGNSMHFTRR